MMDNDVGRSLRDGLSPTVEPVPVSPAVAASIPSAFAPFTVLGETVSVRAIAAAADALANEPTLFRAVVLGRYLLPDCGRGQRQEATNRLMQRWRRMGLAAYSSRGWTLAKDAWGTLQAQAIEARRAETQGGSVHESAVRQDAPKTQPENNP